MSVKLSRVLVRETYKLDPSVRKLVSEMSGPVWEAFDRSLATYVRMEKAMLIDDVTVTQGNDGEYEVTITWNSEERKDIDWDHCVEGAHDIAERTHGRIHGSAEGRSS